MNTVDSVEKRGLMSHNVMLCHLEMKNAVSWLVDWCIHYYIRSNSTALAGFYRLSKYALFFYTTLRYVVLLGH